ncbi:predicted protein [Chaetomium globosum CBS 148.51]|uniref:Uncharacterized protein n=1 Tax=Chaetomium globosum (strain ATCC 6205 / CBS 148.51 / DSM 1962 / NBRC 6347 / NRRL 1970) TaxID=306901 RepID=Q2GYJ5_CHAGB|nr:uncharacterized protein CHGG_06959 [Chaetomium globosum CBS 148.51]EAQ85706.1 predicted protein [Chaetomium globosum CBS 148.51]
MWFTGFTIDPDTVSLNVPKRPNQDPNDFFRAQKRVRLGEAKSILDPLPAQPPELQSFRDTAHRIRIGQWLDADPFGGEDVDCPPNTPIEVQGASVAPTHQVCENLAGQRNTLDTMRKIRQQVNASGADMREPEAQNMDANEEEQQPSELLSDLLAQARRSDQDRTAEDNGFVDPGEEQGHVEEQTRGGLTDGRSARATSSIPHLAGLELEDTTSTIEDQAAPFNLSPFELAFALWEKKHNISRAAHSHLREVLQLVQHIDELRKNPTAEGYGGTPTTSCPTTRYIMEGDTSGPKRAPQSGVVRQIDAGS